MGRERFLVKLLQFALWTLLALPAAALPGGNATTPTPEAQKETTRSPHGPSLAIPCENCHTAAGWRPIRAVPEFDHNKTKYPLRGMHEKVQCTQCHVKPVFTDVGKNCADCHADIHSRQMGSDCARCHTVQGWNLAPQQVKEHQNRFPLFGAHAAVECEACHKSAAVGVFIGLSTECISCHLQDYRNTTNPNHVAAKFSPKCDQCHSFDSWLGAKFDHSTTGFLLTNGHANLPCASCHINNNYNLQIAPTDCGNAGCHLTTWQQTNNPPHPKAGPTFAAANCSNCHNTTGWNNVTFDHSTTGFLLTNGHANVPCVSCHISNNYNLQIVPTDCGNAGCHLTKWQQTTTPVHSTSGPAFQPSNCANCHTTVGWDAASFDHSTTGFALVGTHMSPTPTPCASCHVNNNYTLNSADCMGCHTADWQKTQTLGGNVPNHVGASFPTSASACASCHTITTWADGKFDHSTTGFPLTNSHQLAPAGKATSCASCHVNNNYSLTTAPTDCWNSGNGCHTNDYNTTNNPTHSAAGAPFQAANCSTCHNTITWTTATFDHSVTGWPLTGSHQYAPAGKINACTDCHINNNYTFTTANTDCYGCHQTAWTSTQTMGGNVPNHVTAGFPTSQCSSCHDTINWVDGKFDHSTTGFLLTNSHQMAPAGKVTACAQCHVNDNYALKTQQNDCWNSGNGCHTSDYNATNNPTHSSAGAPFAAANCSTCHSTITWTTATFDHSVTGFPLTGAHQLAPAGKAASCAQCHVNNNYTTGFPPMDCGNAGCHLNDFNTAVTPANHLASGFPITQCATCHDTVLWTDGKFDHSTTGWALTGYHLTTATCNQCHTGTNAYSLTAANTVCSSCHMNDYNTATTPVNHAAASFPTTCDTCHDTILWTDGKFDHSTTGWALTNSHQMAPAGKVTACSQCHTGASAYSLTSPTNTDCAYCHTTDWNATNNPIHSAAGSAFAASNCATCHNTIAWTTATFDHSTTGWALTGSHQLSPAGKATGCEQCHNGLYNLTSPANTDCSYCHTTDFNNATTPANHLASGFPITQCATCHDTILWTDGKFDHSTTGWALTGYHLTSTTCNQCHTGTNAYGLTAANTACYGCHMADWTSTQTLGGTVPNHIAAGYPQTCDTCHTTTSWLGATFTHTFFTIPHHSSVCGDCHQVSTDYTSFTCINCHTSLNAHRPGMSHPSVCSPSPSCWYQPTTCYNCHHH
jgi:hypothetical protein